jgi:polyphosphate kinase 2 (PPK2 family)
LLPFLVPVEEVVVLEQVDLSLSLPEDQFDKLMRPLGNRLNELHRRCRQAGIPIIVVFEGWDASGKDGTVNQLMRLIDPRGFKVYAIGAPSTDDAARPFLWRYAIRLPHRGFMTIFIRSWYGRVLVERVEKHIPEQLWRLAYDDIVAFERQLLDDGYMLVKFWLHISKKEQKRRFQMMSNDPLESWKLKPENLRNNSKYAAYAAAAEEMFLKTSNPLAPWTIVEAENKHFGRLKIYETLAKAMVEALDRHERQKRLKPTYGYPVDPSEYKTIVLKSESFLKRYDLKRAVAFKKYRDRLDELQTQARRVHHKMFLDGVPVIVVFEGWDAAGKGGAIKRLVTPLDMRRFEVVSIHAPTEIEKAHHYLWRFWKDIPKSGFLTIFDRSWYGRVLAERIELLCTTDEWQRAYREINEFEKTLVNSGAVIVKFWLHIDRKEQLKRFRAREKAPYKRWKITDEDWRNRAKWEDYEMAVADMIQKTSTTYAPWTVVESNNKYYSRLKVIETFNDAVTPALDGLDLIRKSTPIRRSGR